MMNTQTEQGFSIHAGTMIGSIELVVADLDRSVRFYQDMLGFEVQARDAQTASLGVDGQLLLRLTGRPGARPHPVRTTGLYHFAILVPTRRDLARSLRRLAESRYPISGASDHLVSEALYLDDPD